jgi:hypothetical protein
MSTDNNGSTDETPDQEQQGQQQQTTPQAGENGTQPPAATEPAEPVKLSDDHPLVKTLAKQKADIAAHKTELAEARAQAAKTTKLEQELAARPSQEAVDTLQTRYDRLEGFLQAVGGPLGKALDSRSFTKELFETDKDIKVLVSEWHKANPSTTSAALGAGAAAPTGNKVNPNDLLRAATK